MHCYVKHRDEKGNWWNLEMTTGTFSRSSFIMETFNVSEIAIENGSFMKSLSDIESVAYCICDLLNYYEYKTGRYSDDFIRKCYSIGLQYYPNSQLQTNKGNDLKFRLDSKITDMGLKGYRDIISYPELINLASINSDALSAAFDGIELNADQQALVDMTVNTINSTDKHFIEYTAEGGIISSRGESAFSGEFAKAGLPMPTIIEANGGIPVALISNFGGDGLTVQTSNGTHSIIVGSNHPNGRAVTTGHEVIGQVVHYH